MRGTIWLLLLMTGTLRTEAQRMIERPVPPGAVANIGGFAGNRIEKNRRNYISTFDIAKYVGLMETRNFTGWDWRQGEQPGKWLEAAIWASSRTHDAALAGEARTMLERIIRSQAPDGYIGITSQSVRTPQRPLGGMDAYELYFLQHALLTAYEVWKDPRALKAAEGLGNYFVRYIGPGKAEFWPSPLRPPENKGIVLKGTMHSQIAGHSVHYGWEGTLLIDPMMRLYQLSGDRRYFDWCKWVVSRIDTWSGWDAYSNLDKVADGEMEINRIQPYVHAHTFQMNFLGLLRMYRVSGDTSYLRKVEGAWKDIARRQRYITGGVSVGEHYERDDIKPLTGEMMETCATMSWMQLSQALLDITGDPKYGDAIGQILWNNVFAEQTIDGDANHYFTPPNGVTPKGYFREPDCCMASGERLLSMLPGFIYASGVDRAAAVRSVRMARGADDAPGRAKAGGAERTIYINQFIASTALVDGVRITQETDFPESGKISVRVAPARASRFSVDVRIPAWTDSARVAVNGAAIGEVRAGTYVRLARVWHAGDRIDIELPMHLQWVRHEHYEKTSDRKPYKTAPDNDAPYALVRGPVVYALDDIWYKGDTAAFDKDWTDNIRYVLAAPDRMRRIAAPGPDILGPGYEVPIVLADGRADSIAIFPFANIGKWYRDAAHKPDSNAAAWRYAVWLKGVDASESALSMPAIFGDHMVLQRNAPVPVWGDAAAGTAVTVHFAGQVKKTVADSEGHWQIQLDPMSASSEPSVLEIDDGGAHIRMHDVLVGEVWLCSGQSNMEYSMRKNSKFEHAAHGSGPPDALEKADNPSIRIFLVRNNYSKPDKHIRRAWDTAAGAPLRDFSATGYFFATDLYDKLRVPIGVISNAIPGSRIEPWLPPQKTDGDKTARSADDPGSGDGDKTARSADDPGSRGKFYRTLVRPLAPFALKGILWYQGESNCFLADTLHYAEKMKTLIDSWRGLWLRPDLSFYFVQIAPYYYSRTTGSAETEPVFWAAQEKALTLPHTGMVLTTDLVDTPLDLHPAYKWEVGRRLALLALANDYHQPVVCSGPRYRRMTIKGRKIVLEFTGGPLVARNGQPLTWFETEDKNGRFARATAAIDGDNTVIVKARSRPVGVRFGWNETAQPNLFNKEGLPAMPFRATEHE
ncbi:MAG TPA: beta-L-arabinofuranosidase domain-containing protein [Puia sp.]|nr:beta-L-arabinofuranosidase domain-containing protein [Puia sp.]